MVFLILIAFILVPIIEIAVFIEVDSQIGLLPTIGIVVLTAVIGTGLLRQQGLSVVFRIQENLQADRIPVRELFDGICLVIAGLLLLTPGFVTDAIGFLLFVAPLRRSLGNYVGQQFIQKANVRFHQQESDSHTDMQSSPSSGPVIDGEFKEVDLAGKPKDNPEADKLQIPNGTADKQK
jgi:UPF0716 protein FxsA